MIIFQNGKKYKEFKYDLKDQIETDIQKNSKMIFGQNTIYVDTNRELEPVGSGEISPTGFLFDLSEKHNPELHLIEVGISRYDFYSHILPRITNLIIMLTAPETRSKVVDRFFSVLGSSLDLRDKLQSYMDNRSIHELIEDISERKIKILLIIDSQRTEVFEMFEAYPDSWGKIIKILILKKFVHEEESIYYLSSEFNDNDKTNMKPNAKLNQPEDIHHSERSYSAKDKESAKERELTNTFTRKVSLTKIGGKAEGIGETLIGWETAPPKEGEPYRVRLETAETLRTSPVKLITEADDGLTIMTKNSLYELRVISS